ncbi:hypothetical protein DE146DRAFT_289780 [Phaeosphaeria sp. MPI-PUGE-AT-0046c]|nr:hypothetical protein DE146DRAFT_289780 [Phaeosphaeria sp. MPI-PUGE-AT-0046c]
MRLPPLPPVCTRTLTQRRGWNYTCPRSYSAVPKRLDNAASINCGLDRQYASGGLPARYGLAACNRPRTPAAETQRVENGRTPWPTRLIRAGQEWRVTVWPGTSASLARYKVAVPVFDLSKPSTIDHRRSTVDHGLWAIHQGGTFLTADRHSNHVSCVARHCTPRPACAQYEDGRASAKSHRGSIPRPSERLSRADEPASSFERTTVLAQGMWSETHMQARPPLVSSAASIIQD